MTDAPGSAPAAPPAGGGAPTTPPGGAPPAGGLPPPAAPTRPEWLPEAHWDQTAGIKPEFGQHYGELSKFKQTHDESQAALKARKADDIKFNIKLPDTVKVPEGMKVEFDPKDPRVPVFRELAIKHGWDQDTLDALITADASQKIEAHHAEVARIAAEDKKLGENGPARKAAINSWAKGLADKGELTAEEHEEIRLTASTAAGVTLLERLMAKASGTVPSTAAAPPPPPRPAPKTLAETMWPTMAAQGKAS